MVSLEKLKAVYKDAYNNPVGTLTPEESGLLAVFDTGWAEGYDRGTANVDGTIRV